LVLPAAYELDERLVEQNIGLLRRQLTRGVMLKSSGSCKKNEMRRKGYCFISNRLWGLDHSCLSDTEEVTEVE